MPIIQRNDDDDVPKIVRVSQVIHLSVKEPLRDASDVEEERESDQEVHANYTRHQNLQQ